MALNSYRNNPLYPDRYSRNKRWTKILPVKGRAIQSAELIEMQSIIQDNLKQGFNTLFKNGTPIKGLRVSVASRTTDTVTVTISPGQLYIEGVILDTLFTTLTIPVDQVYNIYVEVLETITTEVEDSTLRDPIKGAFIEGTPGASRLIWTTSINFAPETQNVDDAYSIAQVVNGVILQRDLNPFFEIQKILSKFVFERSGNFCVSGLNTSYVGLSRRSAANTNKYQELQDSVASAKTDQQSSLSRAVSSQQLVAELTSQELQAISVVKASPTIQNQAALDNIRLQLDDAKRDFALYSSQLVDNQRALETAQKSLAGSENLVTDQQIISIAPGVAYVEGFRVAINSPTQLLIPQSLPSTTVESAAFTYRGIAAQSVRTFSLNLGTTIVQEATQYTGLELLFDNIAINRSITNNVATDSVNIRVFYKISGSPTLADITTALFSELADVNADNTDITVELFDNQAVGNPPITNQDIVGSPAFDKTAIKILLKSYINLFRTSDSVLTFQGTNAVTNGTQLFINIDSDLYQISDDALITTFTSLDVDVPSAVLNQPISTSTYQLAFRPVNKVERLSALLTATNIPIVRSQTSGGVDILPDDTIASIVRVTIPDGSQTFVQGVDYILASPENGGGKGVKWLVDNFPVGNAPPGGEVYNVSFVYTETLLQDVDYVHNTAEDTIEFIGRTPDPDSQFFVDYSYFLSKAGLVTVDKDGVLGYILSAASQNPIIPAVPPNLLALASFTVNVNNVTIDRLECRRQTVEDLYDLSERVRRNSVNNAALKLDLKALNNAVVAGRTPIGVFTDSVIDYSKLDSDNTTAFIVPSVQGFMIASTIQEFEVNYVAGSSNSQVVKNEMNIDDYAVIPYTNTEFFSQPRATKTRAIPLIPTTINKRARLYANIESVFRNGGSTNLSPCDPITRAGNAFIAQTSTAPFIVDIIDNIRNILAPIGQSIIDSFELGFPVTVPNTQNQNDFVVKAFNDIHVDSALQVTLKGEGLPPGTPGFLLFIDGDVYSDYTLINGTPSSIVIGTSDGFDGFTVKPDGTVDIVVSMPAELLTGTHTFEIKRDGHGYCKTNVYFYNNTLTHLTLSPLKAWKALPLKTSGSKPLAIQPADVFSEDITSIGIDPNIAAATVDPTITVADTVEKAFPPKAFSVNQTFTAASDYYLTEVKLKISNQPVGNDDELYVFINPVGEDLPRKDILGVAKATTYTDTTVSTGVPGVFTTFTFATPLFLERGKRYNLGLETYAPQPIASTYEIYSAIIDDPDLNDASTIGEQLYLEGALFTSSDGSTFSLESKEDLTFELSRANFDTASTITADLGTYVALGNTDFFALNTRDVVPLGTEIIYKYRVAGTLGDHIPFKPNTVICLAAPANGIEIIAELRTNFSTVSPMLLINGSTVTMYRSANVSTVRSKLVTFEEAYNKVRVTFEYIKPGTTDINVYYSPTQGFASEGTEWFPLTEVAGSTQVVDAELQIFRTTYFRDVGPDTAVPVLDPDGLNYIFSTPRTFFRYRIDLDANGTTQSPLVRNIESEVGLT